MSSQNGPRTSGVADAGATAANHVTTASSLILYGLLAEARAALLDSLAGQFSSSLLAEARAALLDSLVGIPGR